MSQMPELLAPAGSLEKLKVASLYGANAVYLGGQKFGLRAASDNFTCKELAEGVEFAHAHGTQVYVVLNGFLHDQDLEGLPDFVEYLESINVDAVICSDLGVIQTVASVSNIPIHLSTQASCLNVEAGKLWKKMGVKRLILGRECSIKEAGKIKRATGLEVELFIHGSMCMAYSGNCVISNYTAGRDSNRGGCAHSCRFEYNLDLSKADTSLPESKKAYFMSSKDLNGLAVLADFIEEEIDSIKVEGRMKSNIYAGTISKVYSEALKSFAQNKQLEQEQVEEWTQELGKMSHRSYSEASLLEKAGDDSIFNQRLEIEGEYRVAANVVELIYENDSPVEMIVDVKLTFNNETQLDLLPFSGKSQSFTPDYIKSLSNENIEKTKPSTLVKMPYVNGAKPFNYY